MGGKHYQGNTVRSAKHRALRLPCLEQRISAVAKIHLRIRRRAGAMWGILRASLSKSPLPPPLRYKTGNADFPPLVTISVLNRVLFEPMIRVASSTTSTRCAKALTCSRRYSPIYPEDWRSPPPASKTFIELDLVATNRTVCSEQNHAAGFGISAKPIEMCG